MKRFSLLEKKISRQSANYRNLPKLTNIKLIITTIRFFSLSLVYDIVVVLDKIFRGVPYGKNKSSFVNVIIFPIYNIRSDLSSANAQRALSDL
jgi:hypothetical protein